MQHFKFYCGFVSSLWGPYIMTFGKHSFFFYWNKNVSIILYSFRITPRTKMDTGNSANTPSHPSQRDYLVELERQNATLIADVDNLRSSASHLSSQANKFENQVSNLLAQNATLQAQYSRYVSQIILYLETSNVGISCIAYRWYIVFHKTP